MAGDQAAAIRFLRYGITCTLLPLALLAATPHAHAAPAAAAAIPHCFSFYDRFVCQAMPIPRIDPEARLDVDSVTRLPLPVDADRPAVVGLVVDIDAAGEVQDVSIERSSKTRALDRVAVAHARTLRYLPAMQAGLPVASRLRVELVFEVPGSSP